MEDGDSGHPEIDRPNNNSKRKHSPTFDFFAFLFIFGWPGPLGVYMGIQKENIDMIIAGVIITIFLWLGCNGFSIFKDFIKYIIQL